MSLKRTLKTGLKRTLRSLPAPAKATGRILTYHSVGTRPHEMNVTPESFRQQMQWLAENATVHAVEEILSGTPGIAITLDDGYRDNLKNAAPILREYNFPATVFLVTQRMGQFLDHDVPDESARIMTWDEAREWQDLGLKIGGHTATHARLATLNDSALTGEIQQCREDLQRELGDGPHGFAYPYGSSLDYDRRAVDAARNAGFTYALSNRYGPLATLAEPFEARRIWIDITDDLPTFAAKVRGKLDALTLLDSPPGIRLRRALNKITP